MRIVMKPSDTDPLSVKEELIPRFCRKCGRTLKLDKGHIYKNTIDVYLVCPIKYSFRTLMFGSYEDHDFIFAGKVPYTSNYDAYTGEKL